MQQHSDVTNNRPGNNYSHSGISWYSSARINAGRDRLLFNSLSTSHTIILRYWYTMLLTASFNKPQTSYIYIYIYHNSVKINILMNIPRTPRTRCNKFQCQVSTRHLAMLNVQNLRKKWVSLHELLFFFYH